jgi:multiple sugar transport system ATP-binding protein
MAAVRFEHVVKKYGDVTVVPDITLDIPDGEFVVFVGPSGCGKSTLLRMIAGLEPIDGGTLRIGDTVVNDVPPAQRHIAMVFQDYALYPHMTVRRNLAFGLENRKMAAAEIQRRVADAARMLQIEPFLERKPKALSGGQRQRVAMGRAMVREPAVFLFDEPLSNLDAKLRGDVRTEIKHLFRALRTTMVFVTHDQVEAMTMADRIVVLSQGQIQQVGTPNDVYHRPVNRFVAGFIGMPTMNFVPIELRAGALLWHGREHPRPAPWPQVPDGAYELGVRPEHWRVVGDSSLRLAVDAVEPMGSDTFVFGEIAGSRIAARLAADADARPGDSVPLALDWSAAHLFDRGTGLRLARAA